MLIRDVSILHSGQILPGRDILIEDGKISQVGLDLEDADFDLLEGLRFLQAGGIVSMLISAVIGVVVGLVVSLVAGHIFHPVLEWIVSHLRGDSDERNRTNYGVAACSGVALAQLVSAIGVLVGALPVPFFNVVPVIAGFYAALISRTKGRR